MGRTWPLLRPTIKPERSFAMLKVSLGGGAVDEEMVWNNRRLIEFQIPSCEVHGFEVDFSAR